nr:hypothetical protein GCM10020093_017880 [Planobispora longispora]
MDWRALDPDHPLQRIPLPRPGSELPPSMEPARPLAAVPYSFWVLEQLAPDSGVSNLAVAFRTREPLRRLPLQIAVNRLVKRHPALRLRFPVVGGAPVRHLTAPQDAQLKLVTRSTTEETLVADLQRFLDEPFDLGRDLLIRAATSPCPATAAASSAWSAITSSSTPTPCSCWWRSWAASTTARRVTIRCPPS